MHAYNEPLVGWIMGLTLQHSTSGGLQVAHGLHHRRGATGQEGGQAGHTRPPAATSLPSSANRNVLPPDTAVGITSLREVHLFGVVLSCCL